MTWKMMKGKRPAKKSTKGKQPAKGKKTKKTSISMSLLTYKFHALGDYVEMIHQRGTTDSYSTQTASIPLENSRREHLMKILKKKKEQLSVDGEVPQVSSTTEYVTSKEGKEFKDACTWMQESEEDPFFKKANFTNQDMLDLTIDGNNCIYQH
ncbi:hypothetical protein BDM02DRAFT_3192948 [Thelephora ganbajun]|uniref:Uncharacterized protein n=1 Tax=Thelephora ganbajun TaxID=370292 RepID=A0ACB6YZC9_THEGA|nr:hypothetical protein BDM02DRAFT_3192948 [Thelephora ganbajun]